MSFREYKLNRSLTSYIDDENGRDKCQICGNLLTPSVIEGDKKLCNACNFKNRTVTK